MAKSKRLDLILGAKDRASKPIGGVGRALGGLKSKVLAIGAAVAAGMSVAAVISFAKGSVAAFMEQEQSVENLRTALMLAGDESASTLGNMRRFASELQNITTQGDEATLKLAAYVSQLSGFSGDALEKATAATLGLARATGQGQEIMGRAYLQAIDGNFSALQRYVPALRTATTEQEKLAIVQNLASNGLQLMQSDANTTRGAVQQMKNSWGDFRELIGSKLGPIIVGLSGKFKGFIENTGPAIAAFVGRVIERVGALIANVRPKVVSVLKFIFNAWRRIEKFMLPVMLARFGVIKQLVLTIVDVIKTGGKAILDVIESIMPSFGGVGEGAIKMRDMITKALIAVEFGLKNWKQVVELTFLSSSHNIVKFANQVTHFFTDVIPGVLIWLGNNWKTILTDVMNLTGTMFKNMSSNVVDVLKNLPGLISGKVKFSDLWTPITDGFELTLSELPNIARRKEGELEGILRQQVEEAGIGLFGGFDAFMQQRLDEIANQSSFLDGLFDPADGPGFFQRMIDSARGNLDLGSLLGDGDSVTIPLKLEKPEKVEAEAAKVIRQKIGVDALAISRQFLGITSLANSKAQRPQEKTATHTGSLVGLMKTMIDVNKKQLTALKEKKQRGGGIPLAL